MHLNCIFFFCDIQLFLATIVIKTCEIPKGLIYFTDATEECPSQCHQCQNKVTLHKSKKHFCLNLNIYIPPTIRTEHRWFQWPLFFQDNSMFDFAGLPIQSSHRKLVWLLGGNGGCMSWKSDLNTYTLNPKHVSISLDLNFLYTNLFNSLPVIFEYTERSFSMEQSLPLNMLGCAVFSIWMHSVLTNHQPAAALSDPIRQWILQHYLQSVHLLVCMRRHLSIWNLRFHIQQQLFVHRIKHNTALIDPSTHLAILHLCPCMYLDVII